MGFLRSFVAIFRSAHVPFLAGSIAYAAFISLLPMLVLAVLIAGVLGGDAFVGAVVGLTEAYLSPTGQDVLGDSLRQATAQVGLSLLSFVVLLWATLRLFRALDLAFSLLYDTVDETSLLSQLVDGVVVLLAMVLAFAGTLLATALIAFAPEIPTPYLTDKVVLVAFLTMTLLPVYYVFPDRDLSLRAVLPGTVLAAIGWTLLGSGFQAYVQLSSTAELYGVVGGIILLVTWLYFGALILLVGATVNVVLTEGIRPDRIDRPPA